MRKRLVVLALAATVAGGLAAAPAHGAPTADPTCVQTQPFVVLGHQVGPAVFQCLPPL